MNQQIKEYINKIPKKDFIYLLIFLTLLCFYYYSYYSNQVKSNLPFSAPISDSKQQGPKVLCPDAGVNTIPKDVVAKQLKDKDYVISKLTDYIEEGIGINVKEKYLATLPEWAKDKNLVFLADKTFDPYKGKIYVVSTLNVQTGVGGISWKYHPISFFEFVNEGRFGLYYVKDLNLKDQFIQGDFFYTPFRFGSFYPTIGIQQDRNTRYSIGTEYKW